jgi:hypothetical protein
MDLVRGLVVLAVLVTVLDVLVVLVAVLVTGSARSSMSSRKAGANRERLTP